MDRIQELKDIVYGNPNADVQPDDAKPKEIPEIEEEPKEKTKKELEKVAKESEKVAKSIEKLTKAKVDGKGKKFQVGANIRIDDNGKLVLKNASTIQGTDRNKLPVSLQSYVLGLRGLQQMAKSAQEKLNRNEPLTSTEMDAIRKAKTKLESAPQESTQSKQEEIEFKSVQLAGRALARSAERKSEAAGESKSFDEALEKNVRELKLEEIETEEIAEDTDKSAATLNQLKERFGKLTGTEDPKQMEEFFKRKEFSYIRRALEKNVITLDDIHEDDIKEIKESTVATEKITVETTDELLEAPEIEEPPSDEDVQRDSKEKLDILEEIIFSYNMTAVKARQELLDETIESLTFSLNPTDIVTEEEIEDLFKQYRLTVPEKADRATERNLQEARYQMEAYKDYFRRRNENTSRFIIAEYEGFKKGIEKINQQRNATNQTELGIEYVKIEPKKENSGKQEDFKEKRPSLTIEEQARMYDQYLEVSEKLSDEEQEILTREKEDAIIKDIIADITSGTSLEGEALTTFTRNINNLLLLGKEGDSDRQVDRTRVELSTEQGYYCLKFASEELLLYSLQLKTDELTIEEEVIPKERSEVVIDESLGEEVRTEEETPKRLTVRFKDRAESTEKTEAHTRTARYVDGAASKDLNYIMTFHHTGTQETINHEVQHKQKEEYNKIRIQQNNQFTAYKIADAFYRHIQPLREDFKDDAERQAEIDKRFESIKSLAHALSTEFRKIEEAKTKEDKNQTRITDKRLAEIIAEHTGISKEEWEKSKVFIIKKDALLEYRVQNEKKLLSENEFKRSEKVEELVTQMQNHFSGIEGKEGQAEKLTLASLGYLQDEFTIENKSQEEGDKINKRGDLDENAIESLATIRLLNNLVENPANKDKITKSTIVQWSNRLTRYDQLSSQSTLEFIYDLIDQDGHLGLKLPEYTPKVDKEEVKEEDKEEDKKEDKEHTAREYCDTTEKIYTNKIRSYAVRRLRVQAEREGWTDEQYQDRLKEIDEKINRVYTVYRSLLQNEDGLTPTTEEKGNERQVSTDKYDLSEAVDYRTHVGLLAKEGYVRYSFQKVETPVVGTIPIIGGIISKFFSESGLKPRDLAELGLTKDVRQINRNRLLPFGLEFTSLGKRLQNTRLFYKESDKARRERLGIDNLYGLEMKSLYEVIWRETLDAMTSHAQIQQNHAYLLAADRIGLLYFDGEGGQPGVYSKLEDIDKYYDANLFAEINNSKGKMRTSLKARGYGDAEIDNILKGAFNPNQTLNGKSLPKDMQLRLGTVTDYWAGLTKQFRIKSVYTEELEMGTDNDFIEQGRTFDKISSAIMDAQLKAHENDKTFTIRDVIDAVNAVEAIKPGGSLEDWKKQRRFVKINGKNLPLQDVKDYIQAYLLARTYEATATGVCGEREVVTIGGKAFEIIPGYYDTDELTKRKILEEIKQRTDPAQLQMRFDNLRTEIEAAQLEVDNAQAKLATITATTPATEEIAIREYYSRMIINRDNLREKISQLQAHSDPVTLMRHLTPQQSISLLELSPEDLPVTLRNEIFRPDGSGKYLKDPHTKQYLVNDVTDIRTFKDIDTAIILRSSAGVGARKIKSFEGINKSTQVQNYGEIKQHTPGNKNDRSLPDRSGLMTNAIQDVVVERTKVLELYFYHQTMIKAAAQYKSEASKQKEKWVGFARFDQIARWTVTAGVLASIFGGYVNPEIAQIMSKAFLNPTAIGLLLADYFFISNKVTQIADLWSKRKVNAIKSEAELYNQETAFEQALSNPRFNSTRGRLRLAAAVKGAEDVLKQSALALDNVDVPDNRLQNVSSVIGDTAKSVTS